MMAFNYSCLWDMDHNPHYTNRDAEALRYHSYRSKATSFKGFGIRFELRFSDCRTGLLSAFPASLPGEGVAIVLLGYKPKI